MSLSSEPNFPPCHDTIIVGGGPAGLSAALLLGRCGRDVMLFDAGQPRDVMAKAVYGFFSRDGIDPHELLSIGRRDLDAYPSVNFRKAKVASAERDGALFRVTLDSGATFLSRSLMLATGMTDHLPAIDGFRKYYGTSVHYCPYCDGWESRGQRVGVLGAGQASLDLASELGQWTSDIVIFLHGENIARDLRFKSASALSIKVQEGRVGELEGTGGILSGVRMSDGTLVPLDKLYFVPDQSQHSTLAAQLGVNGDPTGQRIDCRKDGSTPIEGLFIAGNPGKGSQMAMLAAAEGLRAAMSLNTWLMDARRSYLATAVPVLEMA